MVNLMERIGAKHFVQGHEKGKVVKDCVLYLVNVLAPQR